jgi:hypothetical protein
MEIAATFSNINWISIVIASISTFVIGGIWYGPVFGRSWMAEFGFTEEELAKRPLPRTFGGSLLLALLAALILDMFIGAEATMVFGSLAGFFAGLGWIATFLGILYLFEMRSLKAFAINAGYCVISLTVMGAILGTW